MPTRARFDFGSFGFSMSRSRVLPRPLRRRRTPTGFGTSFSMTEAWKLVSDRKRATDSAIIVPMRLSPKLHHESDPSRNGLAVATAWASPPGRSWG